MEEFLQIVLTPFSLLLTFFHHVFGNYGVAMILFAIVIKIILFPLSLKGKRSMIQMNMLSGEMQKIQTQYARNREKMNEEIQKLYAREKVNPMGGCLWSMLPVFILLPLYAIIRRPFHYMMNLAKDAILAVANAVQFTIGGAAPTLDNISSGYNELGLASLINGDNLEKVRAAAEQVTAGAGKHIFEINFSFLGLDLSQIPTWRIWEQPLTWATIGLFLIPIVATACNALSTIIMQKTNVMNKQGENTGAMARQMKIMTFTMPLLSLFFCFALPAAMGIYWIVNSVLATVQELICSKLLKKDYERAAAARAEQQRLEKEEEKRKRREAAERKARAIEEAKLNRGKKKKPAEKPEKKKPGTNDNGRIGMRPYARGRCYDPDRYGGVTPYQDPEHPIDEEAVEEARRKRLALQAEEEASAEQTEDFSEEETQAPGEDAPSEEEKEADGEAGPEEETEPEEDEEE